MSKRHSTTDSDEIVPDSDPEIITAVVHDRQPRFLPDGSRPRTNKRPRVDKSAELAMRNQPIISRNPAQSNLASVPANFKDYCIGDRLPAEATKKAAPKKNGFNQDSDNKDGKLTMITDSAMNTMFIRIQEGCLVGNRDKLAREREDALHQAESDVKFANDMVQERCRRTVELERSIQVLQLLKDQRILPFEHS
ncbi:hypothetical protein Hypma_001049 [Hypsizygus marmoreus]|uniref:Uncharacterized protein n=1 Tax=Hypsizygus marmoreus TaxID=39966 RepID=A0A369JFG4_HYPMA|nr:hypothetical protein Hypma_001049 [Hypsizygus marmoreus]